MREYRPHPWLRGGHRMTLAAWARRRSFPGLPPAEARLFRIDGVTQVLAHCHWQPDRTARPTLVIHHGLEGSSDAHYVRGIAAKAFARGFNAVRLNQRNCGGTEHLSQGLYHSGLSQDVVTLLTELAERDHLPSFVVAGYSLGGNVALRLAGACADRIPWVKGVCAVSPTLDLTACMDLLERPANRIYQWHFMHSLRRRIRLKAKLFPHLYDVSGAGGLWSVRDFDDRYTAPHHGFRDAADYYHQMSSIRVVDRIRVPALVITAEDDPFIAVESFREPVVRANPNLTVVITTHGGHCGFIEAAGNGSDGYWAEDTIVEFADRLLQ